MDFIIFLWANFIVGAISFGGGNAYIPMYQQIFINQYHIIDYLKLTEIVGYATALPGPVAPMISGVIGYQQYGLLGFFLSLLVLVIPTVLIFFLVLKVFKKYENKQALKSVAKYMSPAIIALLLEVVLESFILIYDGMATLIYSLVVFLIATFLLIVYKVHPLILIILSGFVGFWVL